VLVALVIGAALLQQAVGSWLDDPAVQSWSTIFIAITVQALPFLVLGVGISGALAAWLPPDLLPRVLPRKPALAVPTAALAGVALPGCECGSVPIAGRLVARGAPPAAALTFLLAAPAINPVVLVATAVAFPNQPKMVLARFLASLLAAIVVGMVWAWKGKDEWVAKARRNQEDHPSRLVTFALTAQHDFLHAGGFLVLGAAAAATLQTVVPRSVLDAVAGSGPWAVLALAGLAVVLAICSEADAFVAASLTQFSATARLAFMVVGPMVDVKLIALQAGTFGRRFATRFPPLTFVACVTSAALVGWWLL
jgi:hypothetical protein